jgi:hypothetical protein
VAGAAGDEDLHAAGIVREVHGKPKPTRRAGRER